MRNVENKQKRFNPINALGWLLGGLSLLNLIEELSPIKLLGKLKQWVEAYTMAINRIGQVLFGWMKFSWLSISDLETHVLVLAIVIIAAYFRADIQYEKSKGKYGINAIVLPFRGSAIYFLLVLMAAFLLPSWFGLIGSVIALASFCLACFYPKSSVPFPPRAAIFRELVGTTVVFLFLVALNYTVFS